MLNNIIKGLQIIQAIEPDTTLRADHDCIWVGDCEFEKYSEAEKDELYNRGWHIDPDAGFYFNT